VENHGLVKLQCDVIPYQNNLPDEVRFAWEALLPGSMTPVFLHPDWLAMAIDTHAVERGFVLIFRDGDGVRGLLPLQYRTRWTAEITAPMAPDILPLIVTPGAEEALWPALAAWLRRSSFLMVRLGRLPPERFTHLLELTLAQGLTPIVRQAALALWAPLPDSWEAYLKGLPKSSRYKVRHAEEKILADFPDADIRLNTDPVTCTGEVETLIRLNLLRWQHQKHRSFLENPRMTALLRRFTAWAVTQGFGCVATLRISGQTVAAATGIHVPGQPAAYYHVVGRHPTALPNQYSPGLLLVGRIIRWAIERGAERVSLGQGSMPYKLVLGGVEHPQWELTIATSKMAAAVMCMVDPAIRFTRMQLIRLLDRLRV